MVSSQVTPTSPKWMCHMCIIYMYIYIYIFVSQVLEQFFILSMPHVHHFGTKRLMIRLEKKTLYKTMCVLQHVKP